jgi:hypothetical protein
MSWMLAALASTAIWIASLSVVAGRGASTVSLPKTVMVWMVLFFVPFFWLPLLFILNLAAGLSRANGGTFLTQLLLFYSFATLLSGGVLGLLYAAAPNPGNRAAAFEMIFGMMLVPSLLSSTAYPMFVLRSRPRYGGGNSDQDQA